MRTNEPSEWVEIKMMVKVQRDVGNESDNWVPSADDIVDDLRFMEDRDLDSGYVFRKFSRA